MPPKLELNRRRALKLAGTVAAGLALDALFPVLAADDPDMAAIKALKPGEYVWYPDRSPQGFVAIVVNLSDQRAYVYRNGVRIGVSSVSTGRDGYQTPTGVFTILQKDVDHHSSVYDNAPMPYTERLTWSGVALHAGGLPGYPSSHGCVHLPLAFSKLLFSVTHLGTPVIIANDHTAPQDVLHPGLVMDEGLEQQLAVDATGQGAPQDSGTDPAEAVSLVASGADKIIIALRGGKEVIRGPITVTDPQTPLGNVVYTLAEVGNGAPARWTAIAFEGNDVPKGEAGTALARITLDASINTEVAALVRPGTTLLITDLPAHPGTRSDEGFVILKQKATS